MDYKFMSITELDKKSEYVKLNQDKIIQLLNTCFDVQYKEYPDLEFIIESDFFVCTQDNNLIGLSLCKIDNGVYKLKSKHIKTYDSFKYLYTQGTYVKDTETKKDIKFIKTSLGPCVGSICKDMNYKNVGVFLLSGIEKYYKQQGYTKLYTVPESNKFKNKLLEAHWSFDNEEKSEKDLKSILGKYLETQNKLIEYYTQNGYVVENMHYEAEIMPRGPGQTNSFVTFYNVMVKKL